MHRGDGRCGPVEVDPGRPIGPGRGGDDRPADPGVPARLRAEAEQAARDGDWSAALRAWRAFNATSAARAATHLAEARAALSLGRAAEAERSLRRAIAADPADPEPVKVLLEILRVEDRTLDARQAAWESYEHMPAGSRREVLRELTLALLADMDDEVARSFLKRWIAADPADRRRPRGAVAADRGPAARRRPRPIGAAGRAGDDGRGASRPPGRARRWSRPWPMPASPTAAARCSTPGRAPSPVATPDTGGSAADGSWSTTGTPIGPSPHSGASWRRSPRTGGRGPGSPAPDPAGPRRRRRAAPPRPSAASARCSNPLSFVPRLNDDFQHLDEPRALRDLADLADHAGLSRLAGAWLRRGGGPGRARATARTMTLPGTRRRRPSYSHSQSDGFIIQVESSCEDRTEKSFLRGEVDPWRMGISRGATAPVRPGASLLPSPISPRLAPVSIRPCPRPRRPGGYSTPFPRRAG